MAKKKHSRYVTLAQYATLCGVSRQAIHDRVYKNETLPIMVFPNIEGVYIDTQTYPPEKRTAGRKPKKPDMNK